MRFDGLMSVPPALWGADTKGLSECGIWRQMLERTASVRHSVIFTHAVQGGYRYSLLSFVLPLTKSQLTRRAFEYICLGLHFLQKLTFCNPKGELRQIYFWAIKEMTIRQKVGRGQLKCKQWSVAFMQDETIENPWCSNISFSFWMALKTGDKRTRHCFKMNAYVSYTVGKTIYFFHLNKAAWEGGTTKEGYYSICRIIMILKPLLPTPGFPFIVMITKGWLMWYGE